VRRRWRPSRPAWQSFPPEWRHRSCRSCRRQRTQHQLMQANRRHTWQHSTAMHTPGEAGVPVVGCGFISHFLLRCQQGPPGTMHSAIYLLVVVPSSGSSVCRGLATVVSPRITCAEVLQRLHMQPNLPAFSGGVSHRQCLRSVACIGGQGAH